jgi:hypothetical protein
MELFAFALILIPLCVSAHYAQKTHKLAQETAKQAASDAARMRALLESIDAQLRDTIRE